MADRIASGIKGFETKGRPPRLGKVRLGIQVLNAASRNKKPSELTDRDYHPQRVDYFVLDADRNGLLMRDFLGGDLEPRELPIQFVSDDPDEVAPFNLELYGSGVRKCVGNGEAAEGLINLPVLAEWRASIAEAAAKPDPTHADMPAPPRTLWASGKPNPDAMPERRRFPCLGSGYDGAPPCPMFGEGGNACTPTMHLTFAVRGFPALGTWEITTGSAMNMERVRGFLAFLASMNDGKLTGVPLRLGLDPVTIRGQVYHVLRFDFDSTTGALMPGMMVRAALAAPVGAGEDVDEAPEPPEDAASARPAADEVAEEPPAPPEESGGADAPPSAPSGDQAPLAASPPPAATDHATTCPLDRATLEQGNAGWGHRVSLDRIHIVTLEANGLPKVTVLDAAGNPVEA